MSFEESTDSNDTVVHEHDTNMDATTVYGSKSRIIYASVYSVSVILSLVTMYAMARTKKTPFAAKFLAAGLLLFDSMHSVFSITRKFAQDPLLVTSLITATNVWTLLSLLTIWMSVIERYLLFSRPTLYLKIFIGSRIRWFVTILWISQVFIYVGIRYGVCYLRYHTMKMFSDVDICSQITTREFIILIVIFLITSAFAYVIIIKIIREKTVHKKLSLKDTFNKLRRYKSTAVVCVHIVSTTVITVSIGVALLLVESGMTKASGFRLAADITLSINSFMDPVLYVVWYPECQLKLLEMFGCFSARLRSKAIAMRYTIYNIVPTKNMSSKRPLTHYQNRVNPLNAKSLATMPYTVHVNGRSIKFVALDCSSTPSLAERNSYQYQYSSDGLPVTLPSHMRSKSVKTIYRQPSDNSRIQVHLNGVHLNVHNQINKPSTSTCTTCSSGLVLVAPSPRYDHFLSRMAMKTVTETCSRQLP